MDEDELLAYAMGEFGEEGMYAMVESAESRKRTVKMSEVVKHNTPEDCWVVLHGEVYDLTEFAKSHFGGSELITRLAGTDGTESFTNAHQASILAGFDQKVNLGFVEMDIAAPKVSKRGGYGGAEPTSKQPTYSGVESPVDSPPWVSVTS